MAAMKVVFSKGRCHCRSPSLILHRYLSSDSTPIQPISYSPKPKPQAPPPDENQNQNHNQNQNQNRSDNAQQPLQAFENSGNQEKQSSSTWTREDFRYVKDAPAVSPVSYSKRVAPLPEGKRGGEGQEMEQERRRIEAEYRGQRRVLGVTGEAEEEKKVLPFPRLIRPEKKEKKPLFDLMDALKQVKADARTTFDETLEAHARLGIDKSRSDLIVRGTLTLPHGGKKALRLAVFAEGADAEEARAAGADFVGGLELIDQIARAGNIDVDKCLATPQMLLHLVKIARILRPRGLMPDKKDGTVITDVSKSVNIEKKGNQIKFKMDKGSIVHVGLGQLSFSEESLRENVGAFMNALLQAKPAGLKKTSKYAGYVNSFHICSTMGAGFPVSIQSLSKAVDHYNKVQLK